MVGDSRRSRRTLNWRNVKKLFDYKRLVESDDETPIQNNTKVKPKKKYKAKGKGYKTIKRPSLRNRKQR